MLFRISGFPAMDCTRNQTFKTQRKTHKWASECEVCQKHFAHQGDLNRHMTVHTQERLHECAICALRFFQRVHLRTHMFTHTGEKPYKCKECNKTFSRNTHLRIHKRIHTGEKPFTCKICEKGFTSSSQLKSHMQTHAGVKFSCKVCNNQYTSPASLALHMRKHMQDNFHQCEVCSRSFTKLNSFTSHMRIKHEKAAINKVYHNGVVVQLRELRVNLKNYRTKNLEDEENIIDSSEGNDDVEDSAQKIEHKTVHNLIVPADVIEKDSAEINQHRKTPMSSKLSEQGTEEFSINLHETKEEYLQEEPANELTTVNIKTPESKTIGDSYTETKHVKRFETSSEHFTRDGEFVSVKPEPNIEYFSELDESVYVNAEPTSAGYDESEYSIDIIDNLKMEDSG